jgi:hypothetical protein
VKGLAFDQVMWRLKQAQVQAELSYANAAWPAEIISRSRSAGTRGWRPLTLRFAENPLHGQTGVRGLMNHVHVPMMRGNVR